MDRWPFRLAAGFVLVALAYFAWAAWCFWYDRKAPNFTGNIELYVYPGTEISQVRDSIVASGKVKKEASLDRMLSKAGDIRPGHYVVDAKSSSIYVSRMLEKGWQTPVNLTLSAIRTPGSLARKISAQMMVDSLDVAQYICSEDSLGFKPSQLFTKIIPDTYQILWTAPAGDIMDRLFRERDAWWTGERKLAAQRQGLTPAQVSVLASIVNGETRYVPEQPAIAAVYLNRLKTGMKLQADPTVAYCFDYKLNRVLKSHLQVDSPYNTYKYYGLPPGPISCPPQSCLEAVLYPDSHNYIFFCADPSFNGTHRFASTYSEHLANAREFQKALTARQKNNR